jgi:hypothetical protein
LMLAPMFPTIPFPTIASDHYVPTIAFDHCVRPLRSAIAFGHCVRPLRSAIVPDDCARRLRPTIAPDDCARRLRSTIAFDDFTPDQKRQKHRARDKEYYEKHKPSILQCRRARREKLKMLSSPPPAILPPSQGATLDEAFPYQNRTPRISTTMGGRTLPSENPVLRSRPFAPELLDQSPGKVDSRTTEYRLLGII